MDSLATAAQGAVATIERAVDDEIARLDNLEDSDLAAIRRRRLAQMKKDASAREEARAAGNGKLWEVTSERDFFDVSKGSKKILLVFWRGIGGKGQANQDLREVMTKIAENHIECKVVMLEADKAPFLAEKMKLWVLPSVVLVIDGKTEKTFHGLDQLCDGTSTISAVSTEQTLFDQNFLETTAIGDTAPTRDDEDDLY